MMTSWLLLGTIIKFILLLRFPANILFSYILNCCYRHYATTKFVDNLNYAARGGLQYIRYLKEKKLIKEHGRTYVTDGFS
jgi:hypothetical protein